MEISDKLPKHLKAAINQLLKQREKYKQEIENLSTRANLALKAKEVTESMLDELDEQIAKLNGE